MYVALFDSKLNMYGSMCAAPFDSRKFASALLDSIKFYVVFIILI